MKSCSAPAAAGNRQRPGRESGSSPDCEKAFRILLTRESSIPTTRPESNPRKIAGLVEYLWANPEQIVTIEEMMRIAAMSRRSLFYNFRQSTDYSPQKYFKLVRLHFVHEELSSGSRSITRLAHKYNFKHLGEFSALYRQFYGVTPSASAKKGRSTPYPPASQAQG